MGNLSKHEMNLSSVCRDHLLAMKWLIAPSRRIGHQWIEALVRSGQSVVNLHPTTSLRLAMDLVGAELVREGLALSSRESGSLIVDAAWEQLSSDGYLGRLERSPNLCALVYESLLSLRLAGHNVKDIDASRLESAAKAKDLTVLLNTYDRFLKEHSLLDEADVMRKAIARLEANADAIDQDTLILIPVGCRTAGLERRFLAALPNTQQIEIDHPMEKEMQGESVPDIALLAGIGQSSVGLQPKHDNSVRFFHAVGEINEIREVFRRCIADSIPLDDVEILHTDTETYVPLIHATACRYGSKEARSEGLAVTFAEGIPASLSRPGRALAAWLQWIGERYPLRLLVDMIGNGLLNVGGGDLSFSFLVRLLRPLAIGLDATDYLPKLDEQIAAARQSSSLPAEGDDADSPEVTFRERRLKGLAALRQLVKRLLGLSSSVATGSPLSVLRAAEEFLATLARSVNEIDRYATEALVEKLQERQLWVQRLDIGLDTHQWLVGLPPQTTVLGSGPRPGHLHVAHVSSGGHSGRRHTFVLGLDDRRFPGAALQDPILLDRERANLSPELPTSTTRLRQKIDDLASMLSRLSGSVTMSWSSHDLVDDRETFPSSVVLSAYRLISGRPDADLEALNAAVGAPVSFAPAAAEKALDESERWLWQLSDDAIRGTNQVGLVEAHFPHLVRGSVAVRQRANGFGPFNGCVPQVGEDLDPFAKEGVVLSASALETAGRCPLEFFFVSALRVRPPDELEVDLDRWLNAKQFGLLLHEVFRRFMTDLGNADQRPQFERDHERLAQVLHETVKRWRRDVPPPNENAFRMQYWQLVRSCRVFLQVEEEHCRTSQPRYFEVALGLEEVGDAGPVDGKDPVKIDLPSGKSIRARGQIDRVDEITQGRFAVWDYKLGSGYGYELTDPFRQGRRVQSVLYLRMMETALREKVDPKAVVEQFGYFFPSIRAHGLRVAWDAKTLSAGMGILESLCSFIAEGAFPATDDREDCRYCDYQSVCRDKSSGVTNQSKTLLDQGGSDSLRHFQELRRG